MLTGRLALLFVLAAVTGDASEPPVCRAPARDAAQAAASAPHVRSTDPVVLAALARGRARSATFRRLVDCLNASNVIVHVDRQHGGSRPSGSTRFISATRQVRYLRITLVADDASDATVALLGHELRHAIETAEAPQVIDGSSYRDLYREIGRSSCAAPQWCFDTPAAVRTGAHVYGEMRARRRSTRLSATQHHQRNGHD